MNERIKELAEQAGIKLPDNSEYNGHIYRNSIERFAQLLEKDIEAKHFSEGYRAGQSDGITETVKQCLEWCDAHASINGTAQQVRNSIKDHFGVEE